MLYKFSENSLNILNDAVPELQELFKRLINYVDITITCSYRGEQAQNKAFEEGKSTLKYPYSKHNIKPSVAVDFVLYRDGVRWGSRPHEFYRASSSVINDTLAYFEIFGMMKVLWENMRSDGLIKDNQHLRFGADWSGNRDYMGNTLYDPYHVEVITRDK